MIPHLELAADLEHLQVQLAVLIALGRDRLPLGRERVEARAEIGELGFDRSGGAIRHGDARQKTRRDRSVK